MSIRHEILGKLKNGSMTMDDLVDALGEPRKRLGDNVLQAVNDGLATRSKDDVTGLPLYTITKAGLARLEAGVGSLGGVHAVSKSEARRQDVQRAKPEKKEPVADDEMTPDDAALLARSLTNRGLADRLAGVAHALRGSGLPALENIEDDEDLQCHVAALAGAYQMVAAQRDAWRAVADELSLDMPDDLLLDSPERLREYVEGLIDAAVSRPGPMSQNHGYAVMLIDDEVVVHDSLEAARDSALLSLKNDPGVGYRVAVVQIVAQAENAVVQRWMETV